jgi:MYXO-CTERM domain-containing protein
MFAPPPDVLMSSCGPADTVCLGGGDLSLEVEFTDPDTGEVLVQGVAAGGGFVHSFGGSASAAWLSLLAVAVLASSRRRRA